jgi:polyhydroxyalkanoate synthase subunit PhaC
MTTETAGPQHESDADISERLAAPLDLLLTDSALGLGRRFLPNRAWLRFGERVARQPNILTGHGRALAGEFVDIARGTSTRAPARTDKRFTDPAWTDNPVLKRAMQTYLAASDAAYQLLADTDLDYRDDERMRFVIDNVIQAAAPANNPLLNPLGYKALVDTGGLSAVRGLRNFAADIAAKPRIPAMVEATAFTLGESIAATPGAVVLRSAVFELIQYQPRTPTVRTAPVLIVPPVINKFYVVDIAPGRSVVEHLLDQGIQVFAISWRNPTRRHRGWGLDTYGQAIIDAMTAVGEITHTTAVHLFATCSGGMLASMVAAHLTHVGRGSQLAGLALGVTVLDNRRAGLASAALNKTTADMAIGVSAARGYLDGATLAAAFAWLRPGDLVWRYWINNYIQGRKPAPFDVLFWNADTTRMAAALHRDMVQCGLANALAEPGAVRMLGSPVDLPKISADTYVIAGIADHISPWQACYRSARLLHGSDVRFVLSTSGHIASLVNPPGNPRASHRVGAPDHEDADEWLQANTPTTDSWWPDYVTWLHERAGEIRIAPPMLGSPTHPPLTPAPGTYVRER